MTQQLLITILAIPVGLGLVSILATATMEPAEPSRTYAAGHRAVPGACRSLPHEMRHHDRSAATWAGSHGARFRPDGDLTVVLTEPTSHALNRHNRRNRVANLVEHTREISLSDLATLMANTRKPGAR